MFWTLYHNHYDCISGVLEAFPFIYLDFLPHSPSALHVSYFPAFVWWSLVLNNQLLPASFCSVFGLSRIL